MGKTFFLNTDSIIDYCTANIQWSVISSVAFTASLPEAASQFSKYVFFIL